MTSIAKPTAPIALIALIALAGGGPALAADTARTITVSGEGDARAIPDEAHLSAGVTTIAPTAGAAMAQNAAKMNSVFAALKQLGITDRHVQTQNFSISPQYPPYNQNNTGLQHIIGYQVSNQVDVTLDDTTKLGPALDALVGAGANQINSVNFSIHDPAALQEKARIAAVKNAMAKAQTLVSTAGATLGPVISIAEGEVNTPRPIYRMAMMAPAAPQPTPTAVGEEAVSTSVTVVFEIK